MGYIAEIHLAHDELLLQPTIVGSNGVTLRHEYEMNTDSDDGSVFISVTGNASDDFLPTLREDPTVTRPTKIVEFDDRTIFRVEVATTLMPLPSVFSDVGGYVVEAESDGSGWLVRTHLPSRQAIADVRSYFRSRDASFQVIRLYDSETVDRMELAGLTEKQRDLLLTALYSGYYDIPRRASQGDLANDLDVSTSAISKQLRRAVSQLIVSSLSPEGRAEQLNH